MILQCELAEKLKKEVERLKTKTKVLIGVISALLLILPLMSSVMADDTYEDAYEDESNIPNGSLQERIRQFITRPTSQQRRQLRTVWFFKDAEYATVEGTLTAYHKNILVVTTEDGRLNIVLPGVWNVDSEVVQLNELFEEGYVSIGDQVTIDALSRTVTNENGVTVTMIFGNEIDDETSGNHLYAVLPVNIEG